MQEQIKSLLKESTANSIILHHKNSEGYECWKEYDSNNNLIHYKDSGGYEWWREYDSNNNLIHYKNSEGYECWYDSKGRLIENPNKVQEFTLEDIAEKLGIPVKNLRIKD